MYSATLAAPDHAAYDVSTLRSCVSGGAALPVEVLKAFEKAFNCIILEGYGSPRPPLWPASTIRTGCASPARSGSRSPVELRVLDEQGNDVAPGEVGEIAVYGENVMKGYWNKPAATQAANPDGWLRTGDLARQDEDGYFFIVDRNTDPIIRGGYNVAVAFESKRNSVRLRYRALKQEIRGRDAAVLALAENYLAGIGPDSEVADHATELVRRLLVVNQASLAMVARAMSLHPRVLQRRLAESGTSFADILDNVRRETAWQLSVTGMQVAQIARKLGYAEQSSYARACRRWFGETPRQLRTRRRIDPTSQPESPRARASS